VKVKRELEKKRRSQAVKGWLCPVAGNVGPRRKSGEQEEDWST
jgi:hypothetical protein